ncbi:flagellar export chaperone FliS [Bacillus sp. APMAM]|nr:flagellar export chaperone FliS [Bacillus sp. APMAM]RTZ55033.1 flagellar export chaperone FliS [Bacillus sp. SAJ1]
MDFLSEELIYQKSSQELTSLLYEGLIDNISNAINYIQNKDLIEANKKIQRANDILFRLGVGINYEAGVIAEQLDTLYNYMANSLIEANYKKDIKILKDTLTIADNLSGAWNEALNKKENYNERRFQHQASSYEKHVSVMSQE